MHPIQWSLWAAVRQAHRGTLRHDFRSGIRPRVQQLAGGGEDDGSCGASPQRRHPGGLCLQAWEAQVGGGSEDSDARLRHVRCWRGEPVSSAPGSWELVEWHLYRLWALCSRSCDGSWKKEVPGPCSPTVAPTVGACLHQNEEPLFLLWLVEKMAITCFLISMLGLLSWHPYRMSTTQFRFGVSMDTNHSAK